MQGEGTARAASWLWQGYGTATQHPGEQHGQDQPVASGRSQSCPRRWISDPRGTAANTRSSRLIQDYPRAAATMAALLAHSRYGPICLKSDCRVPAACSTADAAVINRRLEERFAAGDTLQELVDLCFELVYPLGSAILQIKFRRQPVFSRASDSSPWHCGGVFSVWKEARPL